MSTVESIARPRRNGERRRATTASISKESPAITGVVFFLVRRPPPPSTLFPYTTLFRSQLRLAGLAADVGTAAIQSDLLPDMLRRCTEALVGHLDAAFARIWTLNDREDVLELQASAGM